MQNTLAHRRGFLLLVPTMKRYEEKLKTYTRENRVQAEHLSFNESCHSVEEAARAVQGKPDEFVKNICMFDEEQNLIVGIVKGEDRVSTSKIAEALGVKKVRMATPEEILNQTGYPCGGTPSFGYGAKFLIDERVMEKEYVYTGGGSENSLVKISTAELHRANGGNIVAIRK